MAWHPYMEYNVLYLHTYVPCVLCMFAVMHKMICEWQMLLCTFMDILVIYVHMRVKRLSGEGASQLVLAC